MTSARRQTVDRQEAPLRPLHQYPSLIAGSTSVTIGAAIMTLWLMKPVDLAESVPIVFAMQFNTALCFLLCGVAVLLLRARRFKVAMALTIPVLAFSIAMLIQNVFLVDLSIDTFLIDPFVSIGRLPPGRMPPNVALCFIIISVAILITAVIGRTSRARVLLSSIVFIISTCALLGYVMSISTAQDWLTLARMSPQTALCFFGLSTGLIFESMSRLGYNPPIIAATLAAATYIVLLSMTYVEMLRQEVLFTQELPAADQGNARSTLLGVLFLSGLVFAGLIVYAFRNAENSRAMALQLAESRKRLAAIIDTAVDGFFTMGGDGRMLSANPALARMFGHGQDAIIGRPVALLIPDIDPHWRYQNGVNVESIGQRKGGASFPVDLSIVRVDLGRQVIYSGVVRDISERKRYERDLLDANAELEEFSYRTSHDLRSPIASSIGLMTIAQDMIGNGADMQTVQPVFGRIEQSFRKLDHLIQNIIILTRTKVMDEPDTEIAVAPLVREIASRLEHMETVRPATIVIDIPETLSVRKKASRFGIILENLLSNAIKYRDPMEQKPTVTVTASMADGAFTLSVADNGIGISPGDEQHLFQMFKRFHPQHAQGSGLGLYILRKSAEHLGGTVVYRRQEKGSIFIVTLPDGPAS